MTEVETYLTLLDMGYFEVGEAFKGLADEHVWKRPGAGLLSIGEIAGHIAFWEGCKLAGEGGKPWPDPAKCSVKSPLIDQRFAYYPGTLETPPTEAHLAMTAQEVGDELKRVHDEAVAHFTAAGPDLDTSAPGFAAFWSYRELLKYAIFHVSYHTGQMYSARHLLGEETPDN